MAAGTWQAHGRHMAGTWQARSRSTAGLPAWPLGVWRWPPGRGGLLSWSCCSTVKRSSRQERGGGTAASLLPAPGQHEGDASACRQQGNHPVTAATPWAGCASPEVSRHSEDGSREQSDRHNQELSHLCHPRQALQQPRQVAPPAAAAAAGQQWKHMQIQMLFQAPSTCRARLGSTAAAQLSRSPSSAGARRRGGCPSASGRTGRRRLPGTAGQQGRGRAAEGQASSRVGTFPKVATGGTRRRQQAGRQAGRQASSPSSQEQKRQTCAAAVAAAAPATPMPRWETR